MYKAEKKKSNGCLTLIIIIIVLYFIGKLSDKTTQTVIDQPTPRLPTLSLIMTVTPGERSNLVDSIPKKVEQAGCPDGCTDHVVGCDIKGNISFDSREKIYHLPGQEYYTDTVINPKYDERWFCTEEEAINNGWRKAYN